jgi:hypothetical protein
MQEIWKEVHGYEGIYEVSNIGNIRSLKFNKIKDIRPGLNTSGYFIVALCKNNNQITKKLHRLIAKSFIDNPENKPCINHKDGNKINNNISNLEWCTFSENNQHAYDIGLKKGTTYLKGKFGKDHHLSMAIIQLSKDNEILNEFGSIREAQRKTGILKSGISRVCRMERKTAGGFIWKFK